MVTKQNLTKMSVDELLKLRDDVGAALQDRASQMQRNLAQLHDWATPGNGRRMGRGSALAGRKVPIKYRDKSGNHWSGRGAQPRWMMAAIKAGAKREDFLVDKSSVKKGRSKKRRAKK
jgi:DNA-binding protein H-NS